MMRPLRESVGSGSPIEAEAINLLRSAPGHEPPAGQKQRVRARLLQQRVTHRAVVFRPVVVICVVLCAAAASAAVGRHWIAQTVQSLVSPSVRRPSGKAASSASARRARTVGTIATAVTSAPGTEITPGEATPGETPADQAGAVGLGAIGTLAGDASSVPSSFSSRASASGRASAIRPPGNGSAVTRRTVAVATEPARGRTMRAAEDTDLVFDAMRALRQHGQPARASNLLDEYLDRHPAGALAEEALALSVEAAVMRRDARAEALADLYMARYPSGYFRAAVESARRRLAP